MSKLPILINIITLVFCTNRILIEEEQIIVKLFGFVSNTVGKKGSLILDAEISDPSVFPQNYEKDILF
jgi:hypothetical protein